MIKKEDYLTDEEVSQILGISKLSLQKRRCLGKGHPPFIKPTAKALYPRKEFEAWMKNRELKEEVSLDGKRV